MEPTSPAPYFHEDSGSVRFWVGSGPDVYVGASIRKETLHFRFHAAMSGADALETYRTHRTEIDAAVLRRIASGSIEPVMLRESDVAPRQADYS
jgi:hypothetical protein